MNQQAEVEKLSPGERDLIENYRNTKPEKRASLLALSGDYCRLFPLEASPPVLRLVADWRQNT